MDEVPRNGPSVYAKSSSSMMMIITVDCRDAEGAGKVYRDGVSMGTVYFTASLCMPQSHFRFPE